MEQLSSILCFGGRQLRFKHVAETVRCEMTFSIYLPPQVSEKPVPVLYWLSGLTCTDENFVQKAGAQQFAAKHGVAIVAPDTSPRGKNVPDDPDGNWDFGLGAGFYLNASQSPWAENYHMYDYVLEELPSLLATGFNLDLSRQSIFGHSMGGHGALTLGIKNPDRFKSISAFAPICAPMQCPWGEKAFRHYLGDNRESWRQYDTCELIAQCENHIPILVDFGTADGFLTEQLKPELLEKACDTHRYPIRIRQQTGYDHSYFFIASFIGEHVEFHAENLR